MSLAALKFALTLFAENISINETEVKVAQSCLSVAHQVPLAMEFSTQEYCSGLPFPFLGYLLNPGIELKFSTQINK